MLNLENMEEVDESCVAGRRKMFDLLDPKINTTINLPNEQEGKGKYCLDHRWLSPGIRWFLFDFAFMFARENFVMFLF